MGVCVEPPEFVIGLQHFAQHVRRTAEERLGTPGGKSPKSQAGDLDLVTYSLRKWARLAVAGNPTVLLLLFIPAADLVTVTPLGDRLRANAHLFAARTAAPRFLGYLRAQKQRLVGERGQLRVTRADVVERHGYDTKYAMHMLRLGYQGVEYLETGRLSLPMAGPARERCMQVRRGEVALDDVLTEVGLLEERLIDLQAHSSLPAEPDREAIDRLLVGIYEEGWEVLWARP